MGLRRSAPLMPPLRGVLFALIVKVDGEEGRADAAGISAALGNNKISNPTETAET